MKLRSDSHHLGEHFGTILLGPDRRRSLQASSRSYATKYYAIVSICVEAGMRGNQPIIVYGSNPAKEFFDVPFVLAIGVLVGESRSNDIDFFEEIDVGTNCLRALWGKLEEFSNCIIQLRFDRAKMAKEATN